MTTFLLYLGVGIGTLSLAFGWTQTELPLMGLIPLALLTFWLFALKRKLPWASALGLFILTALSTLGVGRGLPFWYALIAVAGRAGRLGFG